jgi:hypothetical protein
LVARTNKIRHDENTRAKIQAAQIINRLQGHLDGKFELSQTQVRCAEILLRKVLPDLSATEIQGELMHNFAMVPAVMSQEQWLATRGDPKLIEHQPAEPEKPKPAPNDPNRKLN